tara:strand:- start:525 stop:896 length:372 start_codon:yes stop_codon:yes gene_type:complete
MSVKKTKLATEVADELRERFGEEHVEELLKEVDVLKLQSSHLIGLLEYMRRRCEELEDGLNKYHTVLGSVLTDEGGISELAKKFMAMRGGEGDGKGGNAAVQPQERPGGEGAPPEKAPGQTTH